MLNKTITPIRFLLFAAFIGFAFFAESQIYYPWPSTSYKFEPEPVCTRWVFNSSYVIKPLGAEVGIFNFNKVKDSTETHDNIYTWSTGFTFPIIGGERYCRDQIFRYTQFIGTNSFVGLNESRQKGYQFFSGSSWDLIGWKFMEISAVYGVSFGRRKIVTTLNEEKIKFKNPFFGLVAGTDVRFNILGFYGSGISLSGYCYYMHDVTKNKWRYSSDQVVTELPSGLKSMSGLQFGVGIQLAIDNEQNSSGYPPTMPYY